MMSLITYVLSVRGSSGMLLTRMHIHKTHVGDTLTACTM